jgi:methionyl-tRNA formyltransferase
MVVACGHGAIRVSVVQPAGKRRISPDEWARGRGITVGDRFEAGTTAAT